MEWINVFVKAKLLEAINEEARKQGSNRNAVIQTALEQYIEAKRREREETEEASGKMELSMGVSDNEPKIRDANLKMLRDYCPSRPATWWGHVRDAEMISSSSTSRP